jgi:hypothetical protein
MASLKYRYHILFILCINCIWCCNKKDFLDKQPTTNLSIPSTLSDFQALLDSDLMNQTPVLGELSADNYYLISSFWQFLNSKERNSHIWATEIYEGLANVEDWNLPYKQVLYANIVLDGMPKIAITNDNQQQWNHIDRKSVV